MKAMKLLGDVDKIVVHHTGSRVLRGFDSPSLVRFRHKFIRGWSDIGYHYVIGNGKLTKDGKIYEGRDLDFEGAHTTRNQGNKNSIAITLIGNFNHNIPTEEQWKSLVGFIKSNSRVYGIPLEHVYGHRELDSGTDCPGKNFNMNKLRRDVLEYEFMENYRISRMHIDELFA